MHSSIKLRYEKQKRDLQETDFKIKSFNRKLGEVRPVRFLIKTCLN